MKLSWAVNLYEDDGSVCEKCVLLFVGQQTILKFDDLSELSDFAEDIKRFIPNIRIALNEPKEQRIYLDAGYYTKDRLDKITATLMLMSM